MFSSILNSPEAVIINNYDTMAITYFYTRMSED